MQIALQGTQTVEVSVYGIQGHGKICFTHLAEADGIFLLHAECVSKLHAAVFDGKGMIICEWIMIAYKILAQCKNTQLVFPFAAEYAAQVTGKNSYLSLCSHADHGGIAYISGMGIAHMTASFYAVYEFTLLYIPIQAVSTPRNVSTFQKNAPRYLRRTGLKV